MPEPAICTTPQASWRIWSKGVRPLFQEMAKGNRLTKVRRSPRSLDVMPGTFVLSIHLEVLAVRIIHPAGRPVFDNPEPEKLGAFPKLI